MKRFASIITAFAVAATVAFMPSGDAAAQSSAALSITPKKNYTIEAGKSVRDTLTIRNLDRERTLDLTLNVVDFTFKDDGGTPELMLAEDAPQTTWSLKPFIKVPKTVKIKPMGSETLDMSVAIPAKQGAGSYYSAIVYSSGTPEGGNVGLSASGVTLVFANVPGTVKENLTLEKFGLYRPEADGKQAKYLRLAINNPQRVAYTLANEGNVAESPVGSITLRHMFGQEVNVTDINPQGSLALIGQTRTFVACLATKDANLELNGEERSNAKVCDDQVLWPGIYTATIDAYYGQNGNNTKEITGTTWFIYAPWWSLVILLLVIVGVILLSFKITRASKSKRRTNRSRKSALRR